MAEFWQADPDRLQPLSLGLVDLDDFAELNEARGHTTGDRVLGTVARVVAGSLQPRQLASKLSGEKFLRLLPGERSGVDRHAGIDSPAGGDSTRFQAGADQFGASVSCAVVERFSAT